MKVEIRDDSVRIEGYVNAVERDSKPLRGKDGVFVEKVRAGAFARALERAKLHKQEVRVLLNHDYKRELTSTAEATTELREDSIGLRCAFETRDAEIVESAKAGKLTGWSFGFVCLKDEKREIDGTVHRDLIDIELREVTILDSRVPAYDGTSVELRDTEDDYFEIREVEDEVEITDKSVVQKETDNIEIEYEMRYLEILSGIHIQQGG